MPFPPLRHPSVFIAAPGDMEYLREAAIREFTSLTGEAADSHGLHVYDYRYEIGDDGFKDWIPAQGQIPLPADPLCRAVVCLLGEKIGTPLSRDFDVSPLGPLDQYEDKVAGVRLVHPWEPGADEEGGFALTGTIFEYLVARRSMQQQKRPPVLLLLIGDSTIREETDYMVTNWGNGRHKQFVAEHNQSEYGVLHRRKTREWEDLHYYPQIRQLINFRRYVEGGSFVPHYVADEEQVRARVRSFLRESLDLAVRDAARAPFKGLETYGQQDLSVFFGREAERKEAVGELTRLWNNRDRPNFFGVIGGSGVGKSSFARTALIGHLCHHTSEGHYIGCVMRTADLLASEPPAESNASPAPLRCVLELALAQIDPKADVRAAANDLARVVPAAQPAWVIERLVAALQARGPEWRLLLAFDQFEELLDQRTSPEGQAIWAPVITLIELAAAHDRIGVLYTLQTNREELISQDPVLGPLWARGGHMPLAFPMYSLEQIIREPFRVAQGIEVESGLVTELRRRIRGFAERCDPESQGSLLPLVSLTLTRIFNACGSLVLDRAATPADAAGTPSAPPDGGVVAAHGKRTPMLLQSDCAHLLDVETAIAQLADEALQEARSGAGADWSDDAVGSLLRRLVRTGSAGRGRYELPAATLPARAAVRRLADAMAKRRLLVSEKDGRVKLVHEAVLRHWPRAAQWLETEWRLLRLVEALRFRVEEWESASRSPGLLAAAGEKDVDEIGEVLVGRYEDLIDDSVLQGDPEMASLRDFGLALLAQHPAPMRVVGAGTKGMRHVHIAALYGAIDLLQRYLELDGSCVHAQRADGRTPLFFPALLARLDVLVCLLAAGARPDASDAEGWQPVHMAASGGYREVLEWLCRAGADPQCAGGPWQLNALHLAAMSGHVAMLEDLLARPGCDARRGGRFGWTATHLAADADQCGSLRALHAHDPQLLAAQLANGWTPLHAAAAKGHAEAVRVLMELGADPQALAWNDLSGEQDPEPRPADQPWQRGAWMPLHLAVAGRHAAATRALLDAGAPVEAATADGDTPLKLAIAHEDDATLRAVLAAQPDLGARDQKGRTPLQALVLRGRFELAALLLEAGAAIDAPLDDGTLLHAVAQGGDEQRLRFLLQHGADVDAPGALGRTALQVACASGNLSAARLLVEAGAALVATDAHGRTALHVAVLSARLPLLEWLLSQPGPDPDACDADGMTALHLAVQGDNAQAFRCLLAAGVKADLMDADGWTPLLLAAQGGFADMAVALVDAGAQVRITAQRPVLNALQAAAEGGHPAVVDVLLARGAAPDIDVSSVDKPSPLSLAVRNGWFATALRLLDHGACIPDDRAGLVDQILARHQQLGECEEPLPDDGMELLSRLGHAMPDLPSTLLRDQFSRHAAPLQSASTAALRGVAQYEWEAATDPQRAALVACCNPLDGRWMVGQHSTVQKAALPWYSDFLLVRVMDQAWGASMAIHYLHQPGTTAWIRLDGSANAIHAVNAQAPIRLDMACVLDYLRFLFYFVQGSEGPVHVLETLEDPLIPRDATGGVLEVLRNTMRPLACDGVNEAGHFLCSAVLWYGNAIVNATLAVAPTGHIGFVSQELIASDLPVPVPADRR